MPILQPQCTSFSSLWVPETTCAVELCSVIGGDVLKPVYFPMCNETLSGNTWYQTRHIKAWVRTSALPLSPSPPPPPSPSPSPFCSPIPTVYTQVVKLGRGVNWGCSVRHQRVTFVHPTYHFVFWYSFLLLLLWPPCSSSLSSSELSVAKLIRCRRSDILFERDQPIVIHHMEGIVNATDY